MIEELENKFIEDTKKRSRAKRFVLVLDQMLNVLLWNGSQDETVSSHIYRRIRDGRASRLDKGLCWVLRKLESKHCLKSLGE